MSVSAFSEFVDRKSFLFECQKDPPVGTFQKSEVIFVKQLEPKDPYNTADEIKKSECKGTETPSCMGFWSQGFLRIHVSYTGTSLVRNVPNKKQRFFEVSVS